MDFPGQRKMFVQSGRGACYNVSKSIATLLLIPCLQGRELFFFCLKKNIFVASRCQLFKIILNYG